ncbi:response regulator transcription factor [Lacibacterium aquatile]|uniref:Response regulator transcription factor n=1 Tax=Lacibacterium aquatile TaxID=1168082 RepID=A0ABW5DV42_9PROT
MSSVPLISIVDDDPSMRVAVASLVRSLGYRTSEHPTAEDFLASGEWQQAGCIVSDIQMPGMSGIDLTRRLAELGSTIPVILVTARTETVLVNDAIEQNPIALLKKPFESEAFIEWIERALASKP